MINVGFTLGRNGDELVGQRLPGLDVAVLENDGRISENEVDGAGDVAVAIELAVGVGIESVLETVYQAPVEYGHIGARTEGYGLVLRCSGCVFERNVSCYEASAYCSW